MRAQRTGQHRSRSVLTKEFGITRPLEQSLRGTVGPSAKERQRMWPPREQRPSDEVRRSEGIRPLVVSIAGACATAIEVGPGADGGT